jgi:hypothetical protein
MIVTMTRLQAKLSRCRPGWFTLSLSLVQYGHSRAQAVDRKCNELPAIVFLPHLKLCIGPKAGTLTKLFEMSVYAIVLVMKHDGDLRAQALSSRQRLVIELSLPHREGVVDGNHKYGTRGHILFK